MDRPIARGRMGVVCAAMHIELSHRVAIKVLSIEGCLEVTRRPPRASAAKRDERAVGASSRGVRGVPRAARA
jgi:hypothetical protein